MVSVPPSAHSGRGDDDHPFVTRAESAGPGRSITHLVSARRCHPTSKARVFFVLCLSCMQPGKRVALPTKRRVNESAQVPRLPGEDDNDCGRKRRDPSMTPQRIELSTPAVGSWCGGSNATFRCAELIDNRPILVSPRIHIRVLA
jgi:hypothetical protein